MGLAHSPRIVTDGLVLALDAGNTKSYPGSGSTWTDLSSRNHNGTLTSGPGFSSDNGGSISIDGNQETRGITLPSVSTIMGDGTGDWTIEFWYMTPSFTVSPGASTTIPLISNINWYNSANGSFWIYVKNNRAIKGVFNHDSSNSNNFEVESTTTISTNIWYHFAFVKQGDTIRLYVNGIQEDTVAASNLSSSGFYAGGNTLAIGRWQAYQSNSPTTSRYGIGNFSSVRIYKDKGLTASEVEQNYNALKGRYA